MSNEILSTLKRCLSQQASVKEYLYDGLAELLEINFGLARPVFELLKSHMDRYCEDSPSSTPPIYIDRCIEKSKENQDVKLLDPIHKLISCAQKCVSLYAKEKTPSPVLRSMRDRMETLARKMSDCDLEDFDLHKHTEFSGSQEGNYNTLFANLLFGIYETLIEYKVSRPDSANSAETVTKLFEKYKELKELVKGTKEKGSGTKKKASSSTSTKGKKSDKGKGKKKASDEEEERERESEHEEKEKKTKKGTKKITSGTVKISPVQISLKGMKNIVKVALQDSGDEDDSWRNCKGLLNFILEKCRDQLNQFSIQDKERQYIINDFDNRMSDPLLIYKHCMSLAPYLLSEFLRLPSPSDTEESTKSKKTNKATLNSISLECFELVLRHGVNCCHSRDGKIDIKQVAEFLEVCNINKESDEEGDSLTRISNRITEFEGMIERLVQQNSQNEIEVMIAIISNLINTAFPFGLKLDPHVEWIRKMCEETQDPSPSLGKKLVTLHLKLEHLIVTDMNEMFLADIEYCNDIFQYVGKASDIGEEDEEMDPPEAKFKIFCENTIHNIIDVVLTVQDNAINEAQWILSSIEKEISGRSNEDKNQDDGENESDEGKIYSAKVWEKLCNILDRIVDVMQRLCKSKITGPPSLHISKTLTLLFSKLMNIIKFCTAQKIKPDQNFRELIDNTGALKDTLSNLLHVITSSEAPNENEDEVDENGKKKKKKKTVITTAKIARESSTIPNLIYAIEALEGVLIIYGKQAKVNFTKKFKRLVNRDFKFIEVKKKRMEEEEQQDGDNEGSEEEEEEEDEEEEEEENRKRKKPNTAKKGGPSSSSSSKKQKT